MIPDEVMDEWEPCAAVIYNGDYENPPEYCDEEAVSGSFYCAKHVLVAEQESMRFEADEE